ncbi:uncharacterized protein LOC126668328 [Mercurialis annua]|uniref:uncharacterized protein LOC126668328 n=1 Tax=Mercurialis annua TaxID=3986 RepID=UPI00215FB81C|nr:uncharacterized protein LOC126668328 [Mercurialis annua]
MAFITPSRGLRQDDPLSPFLFILCAECFSLLLVQAEANNEIAGVQIDRSSPRISHLLSAGDSLLFFKASQEEATRVQFVLNLLYKASGQLVNIEKSSIFFSRNTPPYIRSQIAGLLSVIKVGGQDKYLRLPTLVTKSKCETFRELCAKVKQKVSGWKESFISYGGREVLI